MLKVPRRARPGEETAYVDLAFSILGPVAALLLIFIAAAAKTRTPADSPVCRTPQRPQIAQLARDVKLWWSTAAQNSSAAEQFLDATCPDWRKTVSGRPQSGVLPPPLAGICSQNAQDIFSRSGLSKKGVAREMDREYVLGNALGHCRLPLESMTVPQSQLQFETCRADIRSGDAFFVGIARQIAQRLTKGYNRVDIFGHTDSNPVTFCEVPVELTDGRMPTVDVYDNEMLSLLRAYAFRNKLVDVINRYSEFSTLADRLNRHELRFYAIGVGSAEPKANDDLSRRIEMRFTFDKRFAQ